MAKKIIAILFCLSLYGMFYATSYVENHYNMDAVVIARSGESVKVETESGNEWEFFVDEDDEIACGDEITLIMNTNCTEANFYDDIIENYKAK